METVLSGVPRSLFRLTSDDTAASLPVDGVGQAGLIDPDTVENEVYIQVETYAVRFGFCGVTPTQGDGAVGLVVEPGGSIHVLGRQALRTLQFISETAGEDGVLQVLGVCN